jgi:hypothetical protein
MTKLQLEELFDVFCGRKLGDGAGRTVYVNKQDETKVIKIELAEGWFQNVTEWQVWNELSHTKYAKWLAPCYSISNTGIVLIQARIDPLPREIKKIKFPNFITDTKVNHFGYINDQLTCCDYGSHLLLSRGLSRVKEIEHELY